MATRATTTARPMTTRRPTSADPPGQTWPGSDVLSLLQRGYHYRDRSGDSDAGDPRRERGEPTGSVEVQGALAQHGQVAPPRHLRGERFGDFELADHQRVLDADDARPLGRGEPDAGHRRLHRLAVRLVGGRHLGAARLPGADA